MGNAEVAFLCLFCFCVGFMAGAICFFLYMKWILTTIFTKLGTVLEVYAKSMKGAMENMMAKYAEQNNGEELEGEDDDGEEGDEEDENWNPEWGEKPPGVDK